MTANIKSSFKSSFAMRAVAPTIVPTIVLLIINLNSLAAQPKQFNLRPETVKPVYGKPVKLADLEKGDITESSGLAASQKFPNRFWTHNDSGDKPRLFAFDRQGKHLGTSKVVGAKNVDWEDMAIATINNQSMLIIADIGDNAKRRESLSIYLAPEPDNPKKDTHIWKRIDFRMQSGPLDCEAVAYDPISKEFLLFEKRRLSNRVFALPIALANQQKPLPIAKSVGVLDFIPLITGADISHDGKRLVVTNLLHSYLFQRQNGEPWQDALKRSPTSISMPWRKQGETICFGSDGVSLYATSEKKPTPLFEIRPNDKNQ